MANDPGAPAPSRPARQPGSTDTSECERGQATDGATGDVQSIMHEVFQYARLSEGIDRAEGGKRAYQRDAMAQQERKIRDMIASLADAGARPAAQEAPLDPAFAVNLRRSRAKYPGNRSMLDGLCGELHELKRAYNGDGDRRAEAFDVAVVAYRLAVEGDAGGNRKLDLIPDSFAWGAEPEAAPAERAAVQRRYMDELDAGQAGEAWLKPHLAGAARMLRSGEPGGGQALPLKWVVLLDRNDRLTHGYMLTRGLLNWTHLTLIDAAPLARQVGRDSAQVAKAEPMLLISSGVSESSRATMADAMRCFDLDRGYHIDADAAKDGAVVAEGSGVSAPCAGPSPARLGGDAIAKSKQILQLVDRYVERQDADTRSALRHALMDEFDSKVTPQQLLDTARLTGLRVHLHGVSATQIRAMLTAFVEALPAHATVMPSVDAVQALCAVVETHCADLNRSAAILRAQTPLLATADEIDKAAGDLRAAIDASRATVEAAARSTGGSMAGLA